MGLALQSLIGVIGIPLAAYLISPGGRRLARSEALKIVLLGLGFQVAVAFLLLKLPASRVIFQGAGAVVAALQGATDAGMQMVFGYLAGGPSPFAVTQPTSLFLLAFRGLPLILLMSVLTRLLYHWGVLQRVVAVFAVVFQKLFGIGGAVGTSASANIFVGMVEAPLLIRPYLAGMGRGALFATMAVGMATVAGTVMALYATILEPTVPGAAGHVLAASFMNAPAALLLSRLAVPDGYDDGDVLAGADTNLGVHSSMDAVVVGTMDGARLLVAVTAMLVVATALVALANTLLGAVSAPLGFTLTIERVLGWLAAPVAFAIGIPWSEAVTSGALIAKKVVLNELVAYLDLAKVPAGDLSERSRLILTYALCGFANLGSLGIMMGGLAAMAPERRSDIVQLGPLAVLVGVMATLLSGAVIGTMTWA